MSDKGSIKILLTLLSIGVVLLAYMYVFKPNMDDKKTLEAEVDTLQARYDDLSAKAKNKDVYLKEIDEMKIKMAERIGYFPGDLNQEVSVMFIKGVENALEFDVNTVGLGRPELFYTLGSAAAEDPATAPDGYQCYKAAFPIVYEGSYDGIQEFMEYIMNYKYRMNISSVSIAYDAETDMVSGTVSLHAYAITGGDREGDTVDVDVENGVENLFIGGPGAASEKTYSHDADDGASIATDHDLMIMLNNANNDSTDGIVVAGATDDSYVTSSENSVQRLIITVYEKDGKNYAEYAIGDSKKTIEITSEDLTIYVASSARVDADDENGVRITLDNSTSIPVFFKVDDDDTTSPRFVIGSKTGVAKVY